MRIPFIVAFVLFLFSCKKNSSNSNPIGPTALTATPVSTSQINLAWGDNATNEDGFKIERKTSSGNFSEIGSVGKDVTQYNDGGLTKNTTYTYRVYAFNAGGMSITYSNDATATTFDEVPAVASNLAALAVSSSQINLTWEDKATNETGYKVERKTINSSFSAVETISANATSYSDKGLSPNTYYTYRVYPFNAFGNGAFSNEASDTTFPDINNGLVAYYPFNGNANDESGNSNNGTLIGPTFTTNRFGTPNSAIYLNGIDNWITVPNSDLNNPSNISISVWLKIMAEDFDKTYCILNKLQYDGQPLQLSYNMLVSQTHTLIGSYGIGQCEYLSGFGFSGTDYSFKPNEWTLFTQTITSTGEVYIYINGKLNKIVQGEPYIPCNWFKTHISIGRFWNLDPLWFKGYLDDIKIWNRILSPKEVESLYTN